MTKRNAGVKASPTGAGDDRLVNQGLDRFLTGPVLVATDLTSASDEALRQGDALARTIGGALHICHVVPDLLTVRMLFPQARRRDDEFVREVKRHTVARLQASIATLTERPLVEVGIGIESGSPHAGILRRAEAVAAGVIVVGPGNTAERVVRHARCPVLVARTVARLQSGAISEVKP